MKTFTITTFLISALSCTVLGQTQLAGNKLSPNATHPAPNPNFNYYEETMDKWLQVFEKAAIEKITEENKLQPRQVPGTGGISNWSAASRALDNARANSVGEIQRRRLQQSQENRCHGPNKHRCERCMDGAAIAVAGEIMVCGTVALGIAAFSPTTLGITAFLAACEFVACDIAAGGRYVVASSSCIGLPA